MENLKFEDLPKAAASILEKLGLLEKELAHIKENFQPKQPDELMTRQETADYFKVNSSTLWNWTKQGKLISYGIGNRVYYKRSEIEEKIVRLNF
tara:strand:+ start:374 stop:655 length:282 start_codon:yes stop_codon:yes gene_type:complete